MKGNARQPQVAYFGDRPISLEILLDAFRLLTPRMGTIPLPPIPSVIRKSLFDDSLYLGRDVLEQATAGKFDAQTIRNYREQFKQLERKHNYLDSIEGLLVFKPKRGAPRKRHAETEYAHPQIGARPGRPAEISLDDDNILVGLVELAKQQLRENSETATSPPQPRPAHGARARQRRIPPRRLASPTAAQVPACAQAPVPASVQPAARTDRAALETRPAPSHAQSILHHSRRTDRCRHPALPALAKTEFRAAQTTRRYLRRCV